MDQKLSVRLYGKEVGLLEQTKTGRLKFTYNDENSTPISHSLPIEKKTFDEKGCKPYFNGLLPESDIIRKHIGRIFSVNPNNDFALLKAIGHDCAGALSLHNINDQIISLEYIELEGTSQTDEQLAKHIEELPSKPFFTETSNEVRLSLAGSQDKGAVSIIDNKICLPTGNSPTTHIIKPLIKNLDDTIVNEYFCLKIANKIGINTPAVEIRRVKDIQYLLISRYDRDINGNKVRRLHQEDFCQALGVLSINKYQADGGPGLKKCFDLLGITKSPAASRNMFMRMVIFNYLIGNNDAHAKNFSLLYSDKKPVLAPGYDILSTQIYPKLTQKTAMKIGSSYERQWINKQNFEQMCKSIGFSYTMFKKDFAEIAKELPKIVKHEISNFDKQWNRNIPGQILDVVNKNIEKLLTDLELP